MKRGDKKEQQQQSGKEAEIQIESGSQRIEFSDKEDVIMQKIELEVIERESLHEGQGK